MELFPDFIVTPRFIFFRLASCHSHNHVWGFCIITSPVYHCFPSCLRAGSSVDLIFKNQTAPSWSSVSGNRKCIRELEELQGILRGIPVLGVGDGDFRFMDSLSIFFYFYWFLRTASDFSATCVLKLCTEAIIVISCTRMLLKDFSLLLKCCMFYHCRWYNHSCEVSRKVCMEEIGR